MTTDNKQVLNLNQKNELKVLKTITSEMPGNSNRFPAWFAGNAVGAAKSMVRLSGIILMSSCLSGVQAKEQYRPEGLRGTTTLQVESRKKAAANLQQLTGDDSIIEEPPFAGLPAPQSLSQIDGANVNIVSNLPQFQLPTLSIGTGFSRLSHTIASYETGYFWNFDDDYTVSLFPVPTGSYRTVSVGHQSQVFVFSNNEWVPLNKDGATLNIYEDGSWVYTSKNGMEYHSIGGKIVYPNGFTITRHWGNRLDTPDRPGSNPDAYWIRRQSVTTNTGLQLKYEYAADDYPGYPCPGPDDGSSVCGNNQRDVLFPGQVVAINNAVDYCDPVANSCTFTRSWPTASFSWPSTDSMFGQPDVVNNNIAEFSVTDAEGVVTTYVHEKFIMRYGKDLLPLPGLYGPRLATRITKVKSGTSTGAYTATYKYKDHVQQRPMAGSGSVVVQYVTRNQIAEEAQINGATWTYDLDTADTQYVSAGGSTGPRGRTHVVMHEPGNGGPGYKVHAGAPGIYQTYKETLTGNHVESSFAHGKETKYEYDSRGNITKVTLVATDGVQADDIMLEAKYPDDCHNLKTCNKPVWTKDGKGNQTDYTYHEPSGQLATVTLPAPGGTNTVRPQTRYSYEQKYARFKNASGNIVNAETPVWVLTQTSECISGDYDSNSESCTTPDDGVVTTYQYGTATGPNNLWVTGKKVEAKGQTLLTCYEYDPLGNLIGEISPGAKLSVCP